MARLTITEAAKLLGVSTRTLLRWEEKGKITSIRTPGGHRRYDSAKLLAETSSSPRQIHMSETQTVEAVYEDGVLRPLQGLEGLAENSRVKITIECPSTEQHPLLQFAGMERDEEAAPEEFTRSNQYSIAQVRHHITQIVREVEKRTSVEITDKGKSVAVIISIDEYCNYLLIL